jgi:hypothetical protein
MGMLQQHGAQDVGAQRRLGLAAGLRIEPASTRGAEPRFLLLIESGLQARLNSVFDVHRTVLLDARDELREKQEALFGRFLSGGGRALRAQLAGGGA